ncbi:hypothetical protein DSO57_1010986 [Entomophthora muscae]|uniref:Uncharacterized protein n=1 Tax=Entomophthora muscae TaxID=34485 RepID=A0ACC2URN9_9FUNG|nr:hypothetical protein DSO57_1010986 [Entomophthora muscae]
MHVAVSETQKRQMHKAMLSGYGAPQVSGSLEGVSTIIILDGGAYANIVSIHFLEEIGVEEIQTCDQKYILADRSITPCLGVVDSLQLKIKGMTIRISAAVFNHQQYSLLLGSETLRDLKITTQYKFNHWTIKRNGVVTKLPVSYKNINNNPATGTFLCEFDLSQVKNKALSKVQLMKLQELVNKFLPQFITEEAEISMANIVKHIINTGDARPVAKPAN